MGVTASDVRMTPWMIQGWRPTSVTIQPASVQTKPIGAASTSARSSQRWRVSSRPRHISQRTAALTRAMKLPRPTMTWKATWTMATGGQSGRGKASRPFTSASGSSKASSDSP